MLGTRRMRAFTSKEKQILLLRFTQDFLMKKFCRNSESTQNWRSGSGSKALLSSPTQNIYGPLSNRRRVIRITSTYFCKSSRRHPPTRYKPLRGGLLLETGSLNNCHAPPLRLLCAITKRFRRLSGHQTFRASGLRNLSPYRSEIFGKKFFLPKPNLL